jgi:hypothetical protein
VQPGDFFKRFLGPSVSFNATELLDLAGQIKQMSDMLKQDATPPAGPPDFLKELDR